MADGLHQLMRAQIEREFELAHDKRIDLLRQTLSGIASNGTSCKACQMMNEIATHALKRDDNGGVCAEPNCWCNG